MKTSHAQPPLREGLIAIPRNAEQLAAAVHDLHALGLAPGAITVVGQQEDTPHARGEAARRLASLVEAGTEHEVLGATLGAALGLLGGLAVLALPGLGPVVVAGGTGALALEALSATALGAGLGTVVASLADLATAADHEALYRQQLEAGRWILVVTGTPAELRRAEIGLSVHDLIHTDRI